jgi:hypothetical protein
MRENTFEPDCDGGGNTPGTGTIVIGEFGAAGDAATWTVFWQNGTGKVYARPNPPQGRQTGRSADRLIGRVPAVDYVNDIVETITRSRGDSDWQRDSGIDELARWLRMVSCALDAGSATAASALAEVQNAYYLDYGHTRHDVDSSLIEFLARELWEDLDDTAANASRTLSHLIDTLHGSGNLAQAATASQQLLELAVGLHIALTEAYQLAHRQLPRRPRP